MNKLVAVIYPYDQESEIEKQLSSRIQVEKFINPSAIDAYRYDKVLLVGQKNLFAKTTVDKITILSAKYSKLFEWVDDSHGRAAEILHSLHRSSSLGAFQSVGFSDVKMQENHKFTILFKHEQDTFSEWRMRVKKGGAGLATLTIFDVDFGGKLLRTYDIHLSEFLDGWYSFKIPNPIFKARKKFAVSFHIKHLVGDNPTWVAHQGLSEHSMLINQTKSDLVCCFETL